MFVYLSSFYEYKMFNFVQNSKLTAMLKDTSSRDRALRYEVSYEVEVIRQVIANGSWKQRAGDLKKESKKILQMISPN
jgi:hypothetical protein